MSTRIRITLTLWAAVSLGCGTSGPPSVETTSAGMDRAERVTTLERYVTFRRPYETLDFAIGYHDNDGLVPGPSEWDVRLVARVPASSLQTWVSGARVERPAALGWLREVPTELETDGVDEWYGSAGVTVGLDRAAGVVVYRNVAR